MSIFGELKFEGEHYRELNNEISSAYVNAMINEANPEKREEIEEDYKAWLNATEDWEKTETKRVYKHGKRIGLMLGSLGSAISLGLGFGVKALVDHFRNK